MAPNSHSTEPSLIHIPKDLSQLSPAQQKICDDLRHMGWTDPDIHAFLTRLEDMRQHKWDELRTTGSTEAEIKILDGLCMAEMTDYSHLRRSGTNAALEDYQAQLYLLHEDNRQRKAMLGED